MESPAFSILHKHASVLTPSMFMAHDPQIPSRQLRRKVRVGSCSFLILIKASKIIGPQAFKSTLYVWRYGFSAGLSGFCHNQRSQSENEGSSRVKANRWARGPSSAESTTHPSVNLEVLDVLGLGLGGRCEQSWRRSGEASCGCQTRGASHRARCSEERSSQWCCNHDVNR